MPGSWAHSTIKLLEDAFNLTPKLESWPSPSNAPQEFRTILIQHPCSWRKICRNHIMLTTHKAASNDLIGSANWICDVCSKSFITYARLCNHLFAKHQMVHPARRFAFDTHCPRCLFDFRARVRLIAHLKVHPSCLTLCQDHLTPLTEDECEPLDSLDRTAAQALAAKGLPPTHATLPGMQRLGPRCRWA